MIIEFPKDINIDVTTLGSSLSKTNGISRFKKDQENFVFFEDKLMYRGFREGVTEAYDNNKAINAIGHRYGKALIPVLMAFIANMNDVTFKGLDSSNREVEFKNSCKIAILVNNKPFYTLEG